MRPVALAFTLLFLWIGQAHGQGFNTVNERNHPELDQLRLQTAHFAVIAPPHLTHTAFAAASILEIAYDSLRANLRVAPYHRIRVYLTDEDEYANAFAVPVARGYIMVWVGLQRSTGIFSSNAHWLRKVLAHELAHQFHFAATHGKKGILGMTLAEDLPRTWMEGIAQYQTEDWDALRGEAVLRTAVLTDDLEYNSSASIRNGRLLYAVGNAQVRRFAEQFGDTSLAKLLSEREPALLGLTRAFKFSKAFRKTTGRDFSEWEEDWRRRVNIQFNTIAGQSEASAALGARLDLPIGFIHAMVPEPGGRRWAVIGTESNDEPIRRLYLLDSLGARPQVLAEGNLHGALHWGRGGSLLYSRTARGPHGSLLDDVYQYDLTRGEERRLTKGARAFAPFQTAEGLHYVTLSEGKPVIQRLDGKVVAVLDSGDVVLGTAMQPGGERVALSTFRADGQRTIDVLHLPDGRIERLVTGYKDPRDPVWSVSGDTLAFTTLDDEVPNVFVIPARGGAARRLTRGELGATALCFTPPDSTHPKGSILVSVAERKRGDRVYRVNPDRESSRVDPVAPDSFVSWMQHAPPHPIPDQVTAYPGVVTAITRYRSLAEISHVASFALPWYFGPGNWGAGGFTLWLEPRGKHLFAAGGYYAAAHPEESYGGVTYTNNTRTPSLGLTLFRSPGRVHDYGDGVVVDRFTGGDVESVWPIERWEVDFRNSRFSVRLRLADIDPIDYDLPSDKLFELAPPVSGGHAEVRLAIVRKSAYPWRFNSVHPLRGAGTRLRLTIAPKLGFTDTRYLLGDLSVYRILPVGQQNLFLYGRAKGRTGYSLVQDYVGFSRGDPLRIGMDGVGLSFEGSERVRGYRTILPGDIFAYGSAEWRFPVARDLQTKLLGIVGLGATAGALFVDAGSVWAGRSQYVMARQLGAGAELKNALTIGGFSITHALGVAWKYDHLFGKNPDVLLPDQHTGTLLIVLQFDLPA